MGMSKEFIVDGYNVLLRWRRGGLKRGPGNIERARDALVRWVARRSVDPSRVTLVFDAGQGGRAGLVDSRLEQVRIVFAEGFPSADDWIARRCDERRHDKHLIIVSNDRAVQLAARQARIEYQSADDWIATLLSDGRRQGLTEEPEPEEPTRPVPSPAELTGADLEEFRAIMATSKKGGPPPGTPKPTEPPTSSDAPKAIAPPQAGQADQDLESFYRAMRDWDGDQQRRPKPS
jgi:predicted RNA-binding protein with PIN domain